MQNYRYDEFLGLDQSVLIVGEAIKVPANSPYYMPLLEMPREESPSTLIVRTAGSGSTVNPDQDCTVDSNTPSANNNTSAGQVGRETSAAGGWLHRIFMRFDIASLPATASLAKIRLMMQPASGLNGAYLESVFGIHRVTGSWTETGPTWAAQPAFDPVAYSQFNVNSNYGTSWFEADITALYNIWKSSGVNNGLMLRADESIYGSAASVFMREASAGDRPQLIVVSAGNTYTEVARSIAPSPGQFACHYGTGRLRFHSGAAGLDLQVDYRGQGSPVDASDTTFYVGTTGGVANTYTASNPALQRLVPGTQVHVIFHAGNTGAATLNINSLGAITILRLGAGLLTGQLTAGGVYILVYDGTNFHLVAG